MSSMPVYSEKVVETVTKRQVNSMQMEARPAAFCFIL